MTEAQLAMLLATVGLAILGQAVAAFGLHRRVRTLAGRLDRAEAAAARAEAMLRAVEARLARPEAVGGMGDRAAAAAGEPRRRRLDRAQGASLDGPVLIAVPSLAVAATSPDAEAGAELDRRFGGIWRLADGGADPAAIAGATGVPVGQVELILGLRGLQAGDDPGRDGSDG